jgi:hypothetical protein
MVHRREALAELVQYPLAGQFRPLHRGFQDSQKMLIRLSLGIGEDELGVLILTPPLLQHLNQMIWNGYAAFFPPLSSSYPFQSR